MHKEIINFKKRKQKQRKLIKNSYETILKVRDGLDLSNRFGHGLYALLAITMTNGRLFPFYPSYKKRKRKKEMRFYLWFLHIKFRRLIYLIVFITLRSTSRKNIKNLNTRRNYKFKIKMRQQYSS